MCTTCMYMYGAVCLSCSTSWTIHIQMHMQAAVCMHNMYKCTLFVDMVHANSTYHLQERFQWIVQIDCKFARLWMKQSLFVRW